MYTRHLRVSVIFSNQRHFRVTQSTYNSGDARNVLHIAIFVRAHVVLLFLVYRDGPEHSLF